MSNKYMSFAKLNLKKKKKQIQMKLILNVGKGCGQLIATTLESNALF